MKKLFVKLKLSFQRKPSHVDGKITQSSNAIAKTDTLGDQSDTQILKNTEQSNIAFADSISRFSLLNLIDCYVHSKFDLLVLSGNPTQKEISEAWIKILSQYYAARKDDSNNEKNEIIFRMQELKLRACIISMLLTSVGMMYSSELIKALKDFDVEFEQFDFESEDACAKSLVMIQNMEKNNDVEYEQLKSDLEKLEKQSESGGKSSIGEQTFYDWVASYNEAFKTSHSVESLSTMTYANNCHRLDLYISSMNERSSITE